MSDGSTPTFTYAWKKVGQNTVIGTSNPFTKSNVTLADAGDYTVTVTAPGVLDVTSNEITVTVNSVAPTPPSITTQPTAQTVTAPAAATFSVVAAGDSLTYKWEKQVKGAGAWATAPGTSDAASYTTPATTGAMDTDKYRVTVSGASGTTDAVSTAVALAVKSVTSVSISAPVAGTQKIGATGTGAATVVVTGGESTAKSWTSDKPTQISVVAGTGAWEVLPAATVGDTVTLTATSTADSSKKATVALVVGAPDLASVTFTASSGGTLTGIGNALTLTLDATDSVVTLTPAGAPPKSVVPDPTVVSATPAKVTAVKGTGTGNTNKVVITGITADATGVDVTVTYGSVTPIVVTVKTA